MNRVYHKGGVPMSDGMSICGIPMLQPDQQLSRYVPRDGNDSGQRIHELTFQEPRNLSYFYNGATQRTQRIPEFPLEEPRYIPPNHFVYAPNIKIQNIIPDYQSNSHSRLKEQQMKEVPHSLANNDYDETQPNQCQRPENVHRIDGCKDNQICQHQSYPQHRCQRRDTDIHFCKPRHFQRTEQEYYPGTDCMCDSQTQNPRFHRDGRDAYTADDDQRNRFRHRENMRYPYPDMDRGPVNDHSRLSRYDLHLTEEYRRPIDSRHEREEEDDYRQGYGIRRRAWDQHGRNYDQPGPSNFVDKNDRYPPYIDRPISPSRRIENENGNRAQKRYKDRPDSEFYSRHDREEEYDYRQRDGKRRRAWDQHRRNYDQPGPSSFVDKNDRYPPYIDRPISPSRRIENEHGNRAQKRYKDRPDSEFYSRHDSEEEYDYCQRDGIRRGTWNKDHRNCDQPGPSSIVDEKDRYPAFIDRPISPSRRIENDHGNRAQQRYNVRPDSEYHQKTSSKTLREPATITRHGYGEPIREKSVTIRSPMSDSGYSHQRKKRASAVRKDGPVDKQTATRGVAKEHHGHLPFADHTVSGAEDEYEESYPGKTEEVLDHPAYADHMKSGADDGYGESYPGKTEEVLDHPVYADHLESGADDNYQESNTKATGITRSHENGIHEEGNQPQIDPMVPKEYPPNDHANRTLEFEPHPEIGTGEEQPDYENEGTNAGPVTDPVPDENGYYPEGETVTDHQTVVPTEHFDPEHETVTYDETALPTEHFDPEPETVTYDQTAVPTEHFDPEPETVTYDQTAVPTEHFDPEPETVTYDQTAVPTEHFDPEPETATYDQTAVPTEHFDYPVPEEEFHGNEVAFDTPEIDNYFPDTEPYHPPQPQAQKPSIFKKLFSKSSRSQANNIENDPVAVLDDTVEEGNSPQPYQSPQPQARKPSIFNKLFSKSSRSQANKIENDPVAVSDITVGGGRQVIGNTQVRDNKVRSSLAAKAKNWLRKPSISSAKRGSTVQPNKVAVAPQATRQAGKQKTSVGQKTKDLGSNAKLKMNKAKQALKNKTSGMSRKLKTAFKMPKVKNPFKRKKK